MIYEIATVRRSLCDLQGHSPVASLAVCDFFVQLCSCLQDFNWHSASRSLYAI